MGIHLQPTRSSRELPIVGKDSWLAAYNRAPPTLSEFSWPRRSSSLGTPGGRSMILKSRNTEAGHREVIQEEQAVALDPAWRPNRRQALMAGTLGGLGLVL